MVEGDVAGELKAPARAIIAGLIIDIEAVLKAEGRSERLRDGLVVAIAGPPNVGKSTLINRLARREVAIVVEDEPNVRDLVMTQLTSLGYPATAFPDAPSALHSQAKVEFDILVTDIVLPGGMNGRELADKLAAQRPELRVLFTSGYSRQAIEVQGMLMEGANLLHKPFRKAELAKKLREIVAS